VASRIDNLGTVRARIGMPMMGGRVMPYVTGGFAYGGVKPLTETACAACLTGDTPNDYAKTQTGWTVGGGAEVPLSRRLSLKAEYLYVNLGAAQIGAPGGEINTPGFGPLYNAFLAESTTANIIRVGLNYHF
jgi:outer membrane immunogenic protein